MALTCTSAEGAQCHSLGHRFAVGARWPSGGRAKEGSPPPSSLRLCLSLPLALSTNSRGVFSD